MVLVHFINLLRIKRCILIVLYLNNMHSFFEAILLTRLIFTIDYVANKVMQIKNVSRETILFNDKDRRIVDSYKRI